MEFIAFLLHFAPPFRAKMSTCTVGSVFFRTFTFRGITCRYLIKHAIVRQTFGENVFVIGVVAVVLGIPEITNADKGRVLVNVFRDVC